MNYQNYQSSVSVHAQARLKERFRMNFKQAIEFTERAWKSGISSRDLSHRQRIVFPKNFNFDQNFVKLYQNAILIFSENGLLITAYPIQVRKSHFDTKNERIQHLKKYIRSYPPYPSTEENDFGELMN